MSRLHEEFQRLFALLPLPSGAAGVDDPLRVGADGSVRALVLDIGRPADGALVAPLWQAVQQDLGLPAPAIAISGGPSFQLWWSLAQAIPAKEGADFLAALRHRYLRELPADRVQLFPSAAGHEGTAGHEAPSWTPAAPVPAQVAPDKWSAFVAPGLVPVFEETPWLDFPPNEEGQAELLRGLRSLSVTEWREAQLRLGIGGDTGSAVTTGSSQTSAEPVAPTTLQATDPSRLQDPRSFLLQVMNDERVALPLRIEAAKALLPYTVER
jgi:hypothetical protein